MGERVSKRKIIGIVVGIAVAAAVVIGAVTGYRLVFDTSTAAARYVQVDDAVAAQVDTGEYQYELTAYDVDGKSHETTFKASKRLRDGAYLRLEVMPLRGVVNWAEVQLDDIPQPAREALEK